MWVVTVSPSTKKKFDKFEAKYNTKQEAERAAKAMIKMANSTVIAPCHGGDGIIFRHHPWSITGPELVK